MVTRLDPKLDKSRWGKGPWIEESDYYYWIDELTGYYCCVRRGPVGSLCGYVGISKTHPYYNMNHEDSEIYNLDCHGGITFTGSAKLDDRRNFYIPLHENQPIEVLMIGFDCSHSGDYSPSFGASLRDLGDPYRDFEYVKKEVTSLALQLSQVEPEVIAINKMKSEIGL